MKSDLPACKTYFLAKQLCFSYHFDVKARHRLLL
jgi:hypothetical protein